MDIADTGKISRRVLLGQATALAVCLAAPGLAEAKPKRAPGEDIFATPTLLDVKLSVSTRGLASLGKDPRAWVEALAVVDGRQTGPVGIHLKGTTSFMPLDKKPSLTVSFNKYSSGGRLFGLRRIHLNNSVQNSGYFNDDLASELFRRCGVPSPRTAWAKVRLNERELGLYVLKEGFTPEFLGQHFTRTDGNFYDGGLHHDIWEPLKMDGGNGPADYSDLKALHAVTQMADLKSRWQQLQSLVEVDRFVSMMAMESLTCHIDGYSLMQNNYRIYLEPPARRAAFIAQGLDRMFEDPHYPLEPEMRGVVSRAILGVPEGRALYRRRLVELTERVFRPDWMTERMNTAIGLLKPAQPLVEPEGNAVRGRVLERLAFVRKKLADLKGTAA